jgi:hypothetical protein
MMGHEISERGAYNRDTLAKVLEESGYDSNYLFQWGLPGFWDDTHWDYPEYVLKLVSYFERVYGISDSRDALEEDLD